MKRFFLLARDQRGSAAEFALALPVLVALITGIAQFGTLFFANAGLHNALSEGARLATVFPRPSDANIRAAITGSQFGLTPENIVGPTIVEGEDANDLDYVDIEMGYRVPLNFIFFQTDTVLTQTKRSFVQRDDGTGLMTGGGGGTGTSSGSDDDDTDTSSGATGGDTSSGATGGDTSSGATGGDTSSGSTGGDTGTSASGGDTGGSTGGDTGSTGSSSSGNSNASSSNGNGHGGSASTTGGSTSSGNGNGSSGNGKPPKK